MTNAAPNILPLPAPKAPPKLTKTPDAHIYTLAKTGVKYLKKSICGKVVSRSLKTKSQEVARRKAQTIIEQEYKRRAKCADEDVTFKELAEEFKAAIAADTKLKPRSKAYRLETLAQLERTWPELYEKKPSEIKEAEVKRWADKAKIAYSSTRFNGSLETIRRLFKSAQHAGLIADDPTSKISRASLPLTAENLPDMKQVRALIEELDKPPAIDSKRSPRGRAKILMARRKRAADVIKFMLFTGCRIGATKDVTPANIDLDRNEIILPKIKYDDKPVRVPIFPEARPFFEGLLKDGLPFKVKNPSKVLASACKAAGVETLTCHNMRDLFATISLQHTKDVALVASWLGHKDKGVTLLKRYAHVLNDHSQAEAKKVKFFS